MVDSPRFHPPDPTRPPSVRRARFLELLDSGMRTLEASREVGVSYRTASDWAKGIISSNGRRWTADGVLVWAPKPRDKPPREARVISARSCRSRSASRSPTCNGRVWRCVRSRCGWAGRRRRSVRSCAVTLTLDRPWIVMRAR